MENIVKQLIKTYDDDRMQLSGQMIRKMDQWIFDNDHVTDNKQRMDMQILDLRVMKVFLDFLECLGAEEHTSDWDPYLEVVLRNGAKLETESGYWNFEVSGNKIILDDEKETGIPVPAVAIKKIIIHS